MKVQVISDAEGRVLAMALASPPVDHQGDGPTTVRMVPGIGQHSRILDVDPRIRDLELPELQRRFRVDLVGEVSALVEREAKLKIDPQDHRQTP